MPQAAAKLDNSALISQDEVRISVERLNLDAASFRQLSGTHDPAGVRQAVLDIVEQRGKMQNPVTGSGGMLIGTVAEVGAASPLGLKVGDRVATLVSLTLTPLAITDGLARWDGRSEQVPCEGHAILFARSIAAVLPDDLSPELALAALDVCGAPALTARVVARYPGASVAVIGAAGKSGSLSLAAARDAGATRIVAVVPHQAEHDLLRAASAAEPPPAAGFPGGGGAGMSGGEALADEVVIADARNPVALAEAIGKPVDVTVVCVDVPGCEHGAILATAQGGTVIFFSMATSFSAAALGAEGLAADVNMLIGNGYVPGHAEYAVDLVRTNFAVRALFEARLAAD
ncbi:L-erythro-3,5-diaminohexanoate dehydrogenase [Rhizocola hellebori]|uniref:L-erythro-3,5-diaminohexanoate dehydrogenase n=1 Tax=Rhizocola hellebori TaxID=1392758 RepID=A0A8J3VIR6_9ACTN|nr:L-erythro-3,5-diaminohexanoate dehydrogenase [Rhizocola hellebori]